MRVIRWLVLVGLAAACGDHTAGGPFGALPLEGTFAGHVDAPVDVARDRYGVAHIRARSVADAAFVQGYVMAHDRLPQMDILRRFGAGTLSELFGALDASVIDTDLEMRMHRMRPLAQQTWEMLQQSGRADDAEVVQLLQRFADGVNAYAADLAGGRWALDFDVRISFDPDRFVPWTPVDSLVLGRFQAFALSWTAHIELDLTHLYQQLRATFDRAPASDAAAFARRGISRDIMTLTPIGLIPTMDGFPDVPASTVAPATADVRPVVPPGVIDRARSVLGRGIHTGPLGAPGPHALMFPHAGSNSWAVGPSRANGRALLAGDQHLQLPNPSVFYPTHLMIDDGDTEREPGELDMIGITFAGIPGVILGSNGDLAWTATVSLHDVNDLYLETIAPCAGGGGSCVSFRGEQVPLETFTEEIRIGAFGTITETRTVTYERVPHHGPILPEIADHTLVPRTASQALSVKYVGHEPSFEIRALWNLARARTVDEGLRAFEHFSYGSQNWTMIDNTGSIGWTTQSVVPLRSAAAHSWNATTNPDGLTPLFVLPGDGTAEWEGRLDARYVPHAIDPSSGYLVTANSDPVGATFDGDALNQPIVDGRPLFLSAMYTPGLRTERIATLIEEGGTDLTLDDMARIQHDSSSTVGAKLAPAVLAALAFAEAPAGAPADVATYLATLTAADRAQLATARTLLAGWSYRTPTAIDAPDPDSAATALFNAWMHFFLTDVLADEYAAAEVDFWGITDNLHVRTAYALLVTPQNLVASPTTGQPILCDRMAVAGAHDSCTRMVLSTMLAAMRHLGSAAGFGTDDTTAWRWGLQHRLTLRPLFPNRSLELPAPGEQPVGGFPKPGDNFVVNRSDQGWNDLDFSQHADGPAQRFLASSEPGRPISVKWQLPTGVIFDQSSPHYRDLLDDHYLREEHFDAPYLIREIVRDGESRWLFTR
ncbi:MAG: penicillin acylase family protein [Myxococcota bacterium]|nr:penicillin acylase family protein [Myxococcota bacterium]